MSVTDPTTGQAQASITSRPIKVVRSAIDEPIINLEACGG